MLIARRTLVQLSLAGGMIAALGGFAGFAHWYPKPDRDEEATGWRRIAWPFGRDAFPPGRAWKRDGTEVYVRPKLGFCGNCDTGVVTDQEVDRVTDIDLFDERFEPMGDGRRVRITDLFGRARLYRLKMRDGKPRLAEGIAVSYKCDLVVAIVVGKVDDEPTVKFAHKFLESNKVQVWVNQQLEGR